MPAWGVLIMGVVHVGCGKDGGWEVDEDRLDARFRKEKLSSYLITYWSQFALFKKLFGQN